MHYMLSDNILIVVSTSQPSSATGDRLVENLMATPFPVPLELPATPNVAERSADAPSDQRTSNDQAEQEQQAGPSGLQNANQTGLDSVAIPEGVDPSFLDALPEDIRYGIQVRPG